MLNNANYFVLYFSFEKKNVKKNWHDNIFPLKIEQKKFVPAKVK